MSVILRIADEIDDMGVDYAIDTRIDGVKGATPPYLRLRDHPRDSGMIIQLRDDKLVYWFWDGLGGAHSKDFEFISTKETIAEFDRFIATFYKDTFMPNPYFT